MTKHLPILNMKIFGITFLIILSGLFPKTGTAQQEINTWYFGFHAGIKFPGPVAEALPHAMNTQEPSASIADQDGNLLFYSNGREVWNANNLLMPEIFLNGTLDGGTSSSQGVLAVRNPGKNKQYYLFTCGDLENPIGLKYSMVDLTLDGGNGDIVPSQKNVSVLNNTAEGLAATLAENCSDVWIVTHEAGTNVFRTFLVSSTGISPGPASAVGSVKNNGESLRGVIQFSPKGDRFAMTFYGDNNNAEVFNFDKITGKITESGITIPKGFDYNDAYGVAFSPDGDMLYVTYYNKDLVRQYNLKNNNPTAVDLNTGSFIKMGQAKLGPDGKIYITRNEQRYLAVINSPNKEGANAQYVKDGFQLGGTSLGLLGMPQMIIQPELISLLSIETEEATCSIKGSLIINATGGAAPLKYSVDGGVTYQNSNEFKDLDAGKYVIIVKDKNGCFITDEAEIKKQPGAVISAAATTGDSCKACVGTITIHSKGGAQPVKYSIDGGLTFQTDSVFKGLCEKMYDLVIKDQNLCENTSKVKIEDVGVLKDASIKKVGPFCINDDKITLEANTPGGIWIGKGVDKNTGVFDPKKAGDGKHTIIYLIEGVCGNSDSTTIEILDKENPNILTKGPFCVSEDNIQLEATMPGGVWSGKGVIDADKGIFSPQKAGVGKHIITYIVDDVCTNKDSVEIEVEDEIEPRIEDVPTLCPSGKEITLKASPKGGVWSGDGITDREKGTFDPEKAGPGDHKIVYKLNNVCANEDYTIIYVRGGFFSDVSFKIPSPCSYYDYELNVSAQLNKLKSIGVDSVIWDWGDGTDKVHVALEDVFDVQEHTYEEEGTYKLKIKLLDELCGTDSIITKEIKHKKIGRNGTIIAPNIFTPNGDGINDEFRLTMLENKSYNVFDDILEYDMIIYDRWGVKVFDTGTVRIKDGDEPRNWNGLLKGNKKAMTDNTYFYMIKFRAECYDDGDDSKIRSLTGFVHLN